MNNINVLIDNRWEGNTGIGRVLKEVIQRMPANVNATYIKEKYPLGHPLSPIYLKKQIDLNNEMDVFYSPSFIPPLSHKPFVVTIHDLNHLYFYSKFHKYYLKYIIGHIAKRAKSIITVSEYTKLQIISKLNIDPKLINVVYNGVDLSYSENHEAFICDRPYFFYIGNRRSYKNIRRMIEAFALANIPDDYILMMSGHIDDDLKKQIHKLGLHNRVRFLGDINEAELPGIYKGAYALLFVSLMEGFGLPIVEAMASGTPVITSNISSLPEIAGDAAILVDPYKIQEIKTGIEKITLNKTLHNELAERGVKQSMKFNWNNAGKETWDIVLK